MSDPEPLTREEINELDVQGAWMQRPDAPLLTRLYGQDIARLVAHVRALEADRDILRAVAVSIPECPDCDCLAQYMERDHEPGCAMGRYHAAEAVMERLDRSISDD